MKKGHQRALARALRCEMEAFSVLVPWMMEARQKGEWSAEALEIEVAIRSAAGKLRELLGEVGRRATARERAEAEALASDPMVNAETLERIPPIHEGVPPELPDLSL